MIASNVIDLYRNDSLAILRNTSGHGLERIRKNTSKNLQHHGLHVTTKAYKIKTDFIDIKLNLSSGKFWPYRNPSNQLLYIHAASNHPLIIKKYLPSMIVERVSEISCNKEEFIQAILLYSEAPKNNGYTPSLNFQQEQLKRKSLVRKGNVVSVCRASGRNFSRGYEGRCQAPKSLPNMTKNKRPKKGLL